MALKQIPKEKKEAYNAIVKDLREQVDTVQKKAQKFEREGSRNNEVNSQYKKIAACNVYLDTVNIYCKMNDYSIQIMDIKNDAYLTNARKNIYQAIKMLESIFGTFVDTALTDNAEVLERLPLLTPKRVLYLLKKVEYSITYVEMEEGETSKWKWAFVEMYGKFAALAKNMVNFKEYVNKMYNPSVEFYDEINEIMRLIKTSVEAAAQKYRTKYELSTMDVADMNKGIELLNLLVRIYIILNEQQQAQDSKKTIEKWKDKLDLDIKKKEEEAKKSKQASQAAATAANAAKKNMPMFKKK